MIAGIHQLHYLPWLRYFHKIAFSDVFVILDDIQYNKNGWQNRNKVKGAAGEVTLTIPVYSKFQQNLDEVKIDNKTDWRKKHWKTLMTYYSKAPHFDKYKTLFNSIYERNWDFLNGINSEMLKLYLAALGIKTKIYFSSEMNIAGEATDRLINICKAVGCDTYLSGAHATEAYLDSEAFKKAGIEVKIQEWKSPEYKQLFPGVGFIPDLSIVDLLFNEGEKSAEILFKL